MPARPAGRPRPGLAVHPPRPWDTLTKFVRRRDPLPLPVNVMDAWDRPDLAALRPPRRWHRPCYWGSSSPGGTGCPALSERGDALWRRNEEGQGLHPDRAHDRRRHHRHPRRDRDPELPPLPAPLEVQRAEVERRGDPEVRGVPPPGRAADLRERLHRHVRLARRD